MPVNTRKIITCCDQCEKVIYSGDAVWFKGSERYCHSKCLIASFNFEKPSKTDKRDLLLREKRVVMMQKVYEKEKTPVCRWTLNKISQ